MDCKIVRIENSVDFEEQIVVLAICALVVGLILLVWSADRFVEGAAVSARYFGISPLIIGMVIIGFGTSAPEMVVSAFASVQGNPGIALGNAYGSNIANIALILGLAALLGPIAVNSQVLRKELPILAVITLLAAWQVLDGEVSRMDAVVLLVGFGLVMGWTIWQAVKKSSDALAAEVEQELKTHSMSLRRSLLWTVVGLCVLVASSRILVWGAVTVAEGMGISDVIIGLTVVAIGTSLPELASSLVAVRRGESDIALGNVLGSNLFNTLAVVGIAGAIHPMEVSSEIFYRDVTVMTALTFSLFLFGFGFGFRRPGRINRFEGGLLLICYVGYLAYLIFSVLGGSNP